jgi:Ca2+-binding EF-hand superfamily protein
MHKVFNVFDRDHDGSITIQDVEEVMNSLQFLHNELEMPSLEQIRVAFDKFDENSKPKLTSKIISD